MKTQSQHSPNMTKAKEEPNYHKVIELLEQKKLEKANVKTRAMGCIRRMRRIAAASRAVEREILMIVRQDVGELDDELIDESEILYEELCKDSEKMKESLHQFMFWCLDYKPTAPTAPA